MISRSNAGCTFDINTRNTMGLEWDSTVLHNCQMEQQGLNQRADTHSADRGK